MHRQPMDRSQFVIAFQYDKGELELTATFDRSSLVKEILGSASICAPVWITESNPVEGWSRDITEDVARDVQARLIAGGSEVPARLRDFMDVIGTGAADAIDAATGNFDHIAARSDARRAVEAA